MVHKAFAGTPDAIHTEAGTEGERLERDLWNDMKTFNWNALEKKLAPEFQSVHNDGPRNRTGELALIKNLQLGNYTLSNFKTSQQGDTIIVTYTVSADETIDDRRLTTRPSSRLSIWRNHNGQWQWLAHANLISLGNR